MIPVFTANLSVADSRSLRAFIQLYIFIRLSLLLPVGISEIDHVLHQQLLYG